MNYPQFHALLILRAGIPAGFDDGQLPQLTVEVGPLYPKGLCRIPHPAVMLSYHCSDVVPLEPQPGIAQGRASGRPHFRSVQADLGQDILQPD